TRRRALARGAGSTLGLLHRHGPRGGGIAAPAQGYERHPDAPQASGARAGRGVPGVLSRALSARRRGPPGRASCAEPLFPETRTMHLSDRRVSSLPRRLTAVVFLAALTACSGAVATTGAQAADSRATSRSGNPDARYLYACVQDEARIDVIDMTSLEVVARVDLTELGFGPNATPHHVAVAPDGSEWFVSLIGENRVARFDRDNRLRGTFEMSTPGMLALDPERDLLLVSRSMSAVNPPTRIGVIET